MTAIGNTDAASTVRADPITPKKKATAESLRTMIDAVTDQLNQRNLGLDNPVFVAYIDPDFASAPGPPAPQTPVSWAVFMETMKVRTEKFPEYFMRNLGCDTYINDQVGNADVFANYELTGVPSGVTKMGVSVFRFRRSIEDQAWRLYAIEVANGMGAS